MAKNVKGITVEIGGDTTKLGKALGEVDKITRGLQRELRGVESLLKMDPKNVTLLKQKQDLLNKSIDQTREKLKTLKDAQAQVQAQFDKGEITEEQFRDFQREIVATEQKLKSLEQEAKNFGTVLGQKLQESGKNIQDYGRKVEDLGKKFAPVSAVAAGALALAGKSAIDFESAWAGVTKTVDGTPEQMNKIRQAILDLSGELPATAEEIAAVAENAGQLGIETENVMDFTKVMIDMGEATNLSSEDAAVSLAKFANITQMSQSDFSKLGSTIVSLGNNMATTERDIVEMGMRLAGSGHQVGLTESQIMALSATMSSLGINAESGGSSMSRVMQKMNTSVMEGGDALDNFAKVSGMSSAEFKKAFEEDASQAIVAFIKGLDNVKKSGGDVTSTLKDLGIKSTQEIDTLMRMSGASDLLSDALGMANDAWSENSALTNEAQQRYETTQAKIDMLKNKLVAIGIQLGEILLPIINQAVDFIGKLMDKFSGLSDTTKTVIVVILAIVAAIAPVLIIVGQMIQAIGGAVIIVGKLIPIILKVGSAIGGLMNPIGIAIAIIGSLVAAFVYLWKNNEGFREFWINLWDTIKEKFAAFSEWFSNAIVVLVAWFVETWGQIKTFFTELWDSIVEIAQTTWTTVVQFFTDLWTSIQEIWTTVVNGTKEAWNSILTFFTDLWVSIVEGAQAGWQLFMDIIMAVVQPLIDSIKMLFDLISPYLTTIWETIRSMAAAAWELIKIAILTPILLLIDLVTGDFEGMKSHILQIWDNIKMYAGIIWNGLKTVISTVVSGLIAIVKQSWTNLKTNTMTVFNTIKSVAISVWSALKNTVVNIVNALKNGVVNAWNTMKARVIALVNSIKSGTINAWNGLKNTVTNVSNTLKNSVINAFNALKNGAINAWNTLKSRVISLVNGLRSSTVNTANNLKNGFVNAFSSMRDRAASIVSNIKSRIISILRGINLNQIGRNIIQGLINGIRNMVGAVGQAISDVAGNIKNRIKGALGIKSPSRWMRDEIGKMIPAGISIGVDKATPEAVDSIEDMGDEIKDASDTDMLTMMSGKPLTSPTEQLNGMMSSLGDNGALVERMERMVGLMEQYFPNLHPDYSIVMENGALVGQLHNPLNQKFGDTTALQRRGR